MCLKAQEYLDVSTLLIPPGFPTPQRQYYITTGRQRARAILILGTSVQAPRECAMMAEIQRLEDKNYLISRLLVADRSIPSGRRPQPDGSFNAQLLVQVPEDELLNLCSPQKTACKREEANFGRVSAVRIRWCGIESNHSSMPAKKFLRSWLVIQL